MIACFIYIAFHYVITSTFFSAIHSLISLSSQAPLPPKLIGFGNINCKKFAAIAVFDMTFHKTKSHS